MAYDKKTWANGDDVTPSDFNRIEQGIKDNEEQINNLNESVASLNGNIIRKEPDVAYTVPNMEYTTLPFATTTIASSGLYFCEASIYTNVGVSGVRDAEIIVNGNIVNRIREDCVVGRKTLKICGHLNLLQNDVVSLVFEQETGSAITVPNDGTVTFFVIRRVK